MVVLGRVLQGVGLVLLPAAMVAECAGVMSLKHLLLAMLCGGAAFFLGRMLEGYGRK